MQICSWHNIRGYTKMVNLPSTQELMAKYILPVCLWRDFIHFRYMSSFSFRVYLVLAKSEIKKQFSSQFCF